VSLQTKLTALAQAVGADIKALNAKVTTTESYIQTAGGASLNATSGILPVGAITQSSNPAPFSRNADGTLTCLQDGVYQLNAVINCSSGLAANTNVQYQINVNGSAVGYTTNAPVWPHTTLPWLGKLLAGQVVSVYVAGIGATSSAMRRRGIFGGTYTGWASRSSRATWVEFLGQIRSDNSLPQLPQQRAIGGRSWSARPMRWIRLGRLRVTRTEALPCETQGGIAYLPRSGL
jgi:hypothetical protein